MTPDSATSPEHDAPKDITRTIEILNAEPGAIIGPYRLVRQLGEGGMGVVYHAQQLQPIRREVALKIIKPGMDSKQVIARFESERQALAMMDHTNIARVLDAGTTASGLPYFVMELVNGIPITRYCDSKCLSVRERIELFIPVCKAIQHAHQKGIIHRDIKPSNVLVMEQDGKPTPKVIDFGLAKALGHQLSDATMMTNLGTVVGTLEYMSPEQAELSRQDVDTRSDIYSLGVVLYELLTGTTPLEHEHLMKAAYLEVLQRIREEEPVAPSSRTRRSAISAEIATKRRSDPSKLPKLLHGELDWIAMKALEKDRARRYETANGFIRDIERYLTGEPVEAGPPSAVYRFRKIARKHRVALATGAAFLLLIVAAAAISTWEALRAGRAEKVAEAVNTFLLKDLLGQASSSRQGGPDIKPDPDIKVRTALDRAAAQVGGKFKGQPQVEAAVRRTIGLTYLDLGLYPQAREQIEQAAHLLTSAEGPEGRDTLSATGTLALVNFDEAKYSEAEAQSKQVAAAQQRVLGRDDPDTLESLGTLAATYTVEAKFDEGEKLLKQVLASRSKKGGDAPETIETMEALGQLYSDWGKYKEAEAMDKPALDASRRVLGADHPRTLTLMGSLAEDLRLEGKYPEAEAMSLETLDRKKRTYGPGHPNTIVAMNNLAGVYLVEGKPDQAEAIYRQVVEEDTKIKGASHLDTLEAMENLAATVYTQGKFPEAETIAKDTFEGFTRTLGRENWRTIVTGDLLGGIYSMQGKYPQAEAIHSESMAIGLRTVGAANPNTLISMNRLATVYMRTNRPAEAEKLYTDVLAGMRKAVGPEHPNTLVAAANLSVARLLLHQDAAVEPLMRETIAIHERKYPDGWQRYRCETLLGASLAGQKKFAEGEEHLLKGYQGMLDRKATIPADALRNLTNAAKWLAEMYQAWGKPAKASEWRSKAS